MNRLLVICGQTATGKTDLALKLAKKYDGELVSADSRQVYKYMDVITGKDIPVKFEIRNSKFEIKNLGVGFYTDGQIRLWGYDLVRPDQEFSVKEYRDFANQIIKDILARGKLPILVGGTGLYIKSVIEPMGRVDVPRNDALRKKYSNKTATELIQIFTKRNPQRAISLNNSDRNNPRRLLRHIEIDEYEKVENKDVVKDLNEDRVVFDDVMWVGLKIEDRKRLNAIIDKRVEARLGKEMDREIEFLVKKDFINYAPKETIGYRQWMEYLSGETSRAKAIEDWKNEEHKYAKRQMTWFKKQKNVTWFDVSSKNWRKQVERKVDAWYKVGTR